VPSGGTASKAGAAPSFEIIANTSGLPAAGFDAAVSSLVLCSVDDVRESACELYRWLKPGGVLLFLEHVADGQQQRAAQLLSRHGPGLACEPPVCTRLPASEQRAGRAVGGLRSV
jgi:SAM-dependent methyltransferase